MRVNIYGEELTDRIEVIEKVVDDTHTFYGVRFYLKFPGQDWWLHRKVDGELDDDSSAVTLWTDDRRKLIALLYKAADELAKEVGI